MQGLHGRSSIVVARLTAYTGENPDAEASGISPRTGGQLWCINYEDIHKKASKYDQEMQRSQTTEQPTAD